MAFVTLERRGGRDFRSKVLRGLGAAGDLRTNEGPQLYQESFSVPYEDAAAQVSNAAAMQFANAAPIVASAQADTSDGLIAGGNPAQAADPTTSAAPSTSMHYGKWMWPLVAAVVGLAGGYWLAKRYR